MADEGVATPEWEPEQRPTGPVQPDQAMLVPRVALLDERGVPIRSVPLSSGGITIGRLPDSDLVLDAPSVSRNHMRVDWDGIHATVTDLGSRGGTDLGNLRLSPQTAVQWQPAQLLKIGPYTLQLQTGATERLPERPTVPLPVMADVVPTSRLAELDRSPAHAELSLTSGPILDIIPGQRAISGLMIANRGTHPETFQIVVDGVPPAWLSLPAPQLIEPGSESLVSIIADVPQETSNLAGAYPVTIRVLGLGSGLEAASALVEWHVRPFYDARLAVEPRRIVTREQASYAVLVSNAGNAPVRLTLSAQEEQGELALTLSQNQIIVEPGETSQVSLLAERPARALGGERRYTIDVITSAGHAQPLTAHTLYVQRALLPIWMVLLLLPMLLAAGWLASPFLFPSQALPPTQIAAAAQRQTANARATATSIAVLTMATGVAQVATQTAVAIQVLPLNERATAQVVANATQVANATAFAQRATQATLEFAQTVTALSLTQLPTAAGAGSNTVIPNTTNPTQTPLIPAVFTPTATASSSPTPSPSPTGITVVGTPTSTPSATPTTVTGTPTSTNSPLPTSTNSPLPTSTNSPLPTSTNSPLPTPTRTPSSTATTVSTSTNTPTSTPTPGVTINPLVLDFGTVSMGTNSDTMTATLTNIGPDGLILTDITFTYVDGSSTNNRPLFAVDSNTCPSAAPGLANGASCTITLHAEVPATGYSNGFKDRNMVLTVDPNPGGAEIVECRVRLVP